MRQEYVPPSTELEKRLTEIWKKILRIDLIGIYDNFFELGGHSLLATRVITEINKEFAIEIPVRILFEHNSINELSEYLSVMAEIETMEVESIDKGHIVIDF